MTIKITLNEDHLKLIPFLFIQEKGENEIIIDKQQMFSLGSHLLEDIAFVLGKIGEAIPSSINDENGRAFPEELTNYMLDLYKYLSDNLFYIESLIHSYVVRGGLTVGTYTCKDNEMIWSKI